MPTTRKKARKATVKKAASGPVTVFATGYCYKNSTANFDSTDMHKTLKGATECCFDHDSDSDHVVFEVQIVAVHRRPETTDLERIDAGLAGIKAA